MEYLDTIRAAIGNFAGYDGEEARRLADEQIRAFVGERLAALPAPELEGMSQADRAAYDRLLLRCEFINQRAFGAFNECATPDRVASVAASDAGIVLALDDLDLARLEAAFDRRDAALQGQ